MVCFEEFDYTFLRIPFLAVALIQTLVPTV